MNANVSLKQAVIIILSSAIVGAMGGWVIAENATAHVAARDSAVTTPTAYEKPVVKTLPVSG